MDLLTLFSVYAFLFGAIWGSFLNVVIYRLPRGLSLVRPGSHCPACEAPIRWYDNIPLVSFIVLRGRCRRCEAQFSARYVAVELLTAVLSVLLFRAVAAGRLDTLPISFILAPYALYFYFICAAIAIAFIDLELMVIPDHITVPSAVLAVVAAFVMPAEWADSGFFPLVTGLESLFGLIAGAGTILLISGGYRLLTGRIGMGGGDATTLGMIGAFLGWKSLIIILFLSSVQGLIGALIAAGWERVRGREGGLLRRGVHRPEYWEEGDAAGGGSDEVDGDEVDGGQPSPHSDDEAVSFGKTGLPFGPFLTLAAVEYVFAGETLFSWFLGGL